MIRQLKEQLTEILKSENTDELVYKTEWLGYLPYGQYHWLEVKGEDISLTLCDWTREDLIKLEDEGFLLELSQKVNPEKPEDRVITYRLNPDYVEK